MSGTGGTWIPLKYAIASYLRGLRSDSPDIGDRAALVLARHVPVLGGAAGAASSACAGSRGIQRLGAVLTAMASTGLGSTLASFGLADLMGGTRFDVLDRLVTVVAGDGGDLDSQAARDAACDVLDEVFANAGDWNELSDAVVSGTDVVFLLETFLALYVYNRVPAIAERLGLLVDPYATRRAHEQMRQIVRQVVAIRLPTDVFSMDWFGQEASTAAGDAVRFAYDALEALNGNEP